MDDVKNDVIVEENRKDFLSIRKEEIEMWTASAMSDSLFKEFLEQRGYSEEEILEIIKAVE
jgi:hypothetical protein